MTIGIIDLVCCNLSISFDLLGGGCVYFGANIGAFGCGCYKFALRGKSRWTGSFSASAFSVAVDIVSIIFRFLDMNLIVNIRLMRTAICVHFFHFKTVNEHKLEYNNF